MIYRQLLGGGDGRAAWEGGTTSLELRVAGGARGNGGFASAGTGVSSMSVSRSLKGSCGMRHIRCGQFDREW